MEIKVYKDGSKMKPKVIGGLTLRQFLALLALGLVTVILVVNDLFVHVPDILVQPIAAFLIIGTFLAALKKVKGLPFERYAAMRIRYYLSEKVRTYQTERIKEYHQSDFQPNKKIKETDPLESR